MEEVEETLTMENDPRYQTYFKMMRLKIPISGIKQKMMLEGFNPDILDHPNAPSDRPPPGGGATEGQTEEEWDEDD